jgi:chemotaxis protein methyltransferase CheR
LTQTGIEPLSTETFNRFRTLIYDKTNINMREGKHILVANRLRKRILALGLKGYDEYFLFLTEQEEGAAELVNFIDAVSTNETYFFREENHLAALRETILPQLFARKKRLLIWSGGCSTGEEPYTLRILIEEGQGTMWDGEVEIIATDISHEVIRRAQEGVYGPRSLRLVPPAVLKRFFTALPSGSYRVADRLRSKVEFRVHNLIKDPPPARNVDVIFCRNVMIYFDKATQRRLTDDYFAEVLDPRGFLCIGHSESLSGTSTRFRFLRGLKAPVYQLVREQVRA